MIRRYALLGLFAFALMGRTDAPLAQVAPRGPHSPPYGYPDPRAVSYPANICTTEWGREALKNIGSS
jgi:hypothetical protein